MSIDRPRGTSDKNPDATPQHERSSRHPDSGQDVQATPAAEFRMAQREAYDSARSGFEIRHGRGRGEILNARDMPPDDAALVKHPDASARVVAREHGSVPSDRASEKRDIGDTTVLTDRPSLPTQGSTATYEPLLKREDGTLEPPFNGRPTREQAQQGSLGDCGVIATLGAVAAHRPDVIREAVRETADGNYEVLLHETRQVPGMLKCEPTGNKITLTVTPDLPVSTYEAGQPAFASRGTRETGASWGAVLEKATAGVDDAWTPERRADWEHTWGVLADYRPNPDAPVPDGYARLDEGTSPLDRAELLTQLTGEPSAVRALPDDFDIGQGDAISKDTMLAQTFRVLLDEHKPILVGSREILPQEMELPHELEARHAYEVIDIGQDGKIQLRNPWNHSHPEPMTPRQFRDNMQPYYTTLERRS